MQAAGARTRKRLSEVQGGCGDKEQTREQAKSSQQPANKKQKRSRSDAATAPLPKKRRSAPELPKAGGSLGNATPVASFRYNLRKRSSVPGPGRLTDGSVPSSMPSSVRPRNPNQKATWNELPGEVLKIICQQLDPTTIFSARGVSLSMREACSRQPVPLRFMLPMQSAPWAPFQLEAWERRVNGLAGALAAGRMQASDLQLRMEGADAWKGEEHIPAGQIRNAATHLAPLLSSLRKLGSLKDTHITHLDAELPMTLDTITSLGAALPSVSSLRFDSLIPPPYNHVSTLTECNAFSNLRKLDVCVTAWDQVQHLSSLTRLRDLNIRYSMWNIPELSPLVTLQNLETFGFEVMDDRARFQLDFLGPLVRAVDTLTHLRASVILSRTVVSDSGPATFDFLDASSLEVFDLDVRVPQDAARVAHMHFRNLNYAPLSCKVRLTIRADGLMREASFDSAATRSGLIAAPRLGMAQPAETDERERWVSLRMMEDAHPDDALQLHLRGYRMPLTGLPDMTAANLKQLQISNARLNAADFVALSGCTTLQHLYIRFAFLPDPPALGSNFGGGASVPFAPHNHPVSSEDKAEHKSREAHTSFNARLASSACNGMLTRSRKSQIASRKSAGGAIAVTPPPHDCKDKPLPYVLMPLLKLENLCSLELLEEREEPEEQHTAGEDAAEQPSGSGAADASTGAAGSSRAGGRVSSTTGVRSFKCLSAIGQGRPPAPLSSTAGGRDAWQPSPAVLPISRSGLIHFMGGLSNIYDLTTVSLKLLAGDDTLHDCPCRTPCFTAGAKGKASVRRLDAHNIRDILGIPRYKVVLGSQVVTSAKWYRPSAWPKLDE